MKGPSNLNLNRGEQGREATSSPRQLLTLELKVKNHPGVMMHVVSLFARRAFNVEGIVCIAAADGVHSRIWLGVFEDDKLPQIEAQLAKLVDVVAVVLHPTGHKAFLQIESFFAGDH